MITYEFVSITCIVLGILALGCLCILIYQIGKILDQMIFIYLRLIDYTVKLDKLAAKVENKKENI